MAGSKKAEISIKVNAKDLNRMFSTFNKQLKAAEKNMQRLNASTKKASTSLNNMGKKGADAGKKIKKGADKGSKGLGGMMVSLLRTRAGFVVLGLIAKQAFDAVVGGAIRANKESAKIGGTVDKLTAEIRTITGERGDRLPLTIELQELSLVFGQTYEAMAKAKYDIVSGGFTDAAESARLLEVASKAAVAGVSSVGITAKLIVQSLRSYGASAEEAEAYSDSLFTTIRLGLTTMPELAASLGRVTPLARMAGFSFDELGAAMAVLTQGGLKTPEAATALRSFFKSIIAGSKETKEGLQKLGIAGGMSLADIFIKLAEAGDESSTALAELFGNVRALLAAQSAGTDGAKLFVAAMDGMTNKIGNMNEAYLEVADTIGVVNERYDRFKKILEESRGLGAGAGAKKAKEEFLDATDGMVAAAFGYAAAAGESATKAELWLDKMHNGFKNIGKEIIGTNARFLEQFTADDRSFWDNMWSLHTLGLSDMKAASESFHADMNAASEKYYSEQQALRDKAIEAEIQSILKKDKMALALASKDGISVLRRIDEFNKLWASGKMGFDGYEKAFKKFTGRLSRRYAVLWDSIVATGSTKPSEAVTALLAELEVGFNNANIKTVASGLGIDISKLVWDGAALGMDDVNPAELSNKLVAMISRAVAEYEKAVPTQKGKTLAEIVGLLGDGSAEEIEAGIERVKQKLISMQTEIDKLKKKPVKVEGLTQLEEQLESLRDKFNLLAGSDWFVKDPTVDMAKLRVEMEGYAKSVGVSQERIDSLYEAMVQGVGLPAEILEYLKQLMDELGDKTKDTKEGMADWEKATEKIGNAIGDNIGRGMADIAAGTQSMKEAFSRMKEAIIADITQIIVKMLVMKALTHITGFTFAQGGELPMAKGGSLPKAAAGMMIPSTGQAGLDSVPFIGMPGEGVIKRNTMQRLERFLSSSESSSAMGIQPIGGGSPMMVNFNIARPQSASDSVGMARTVSRMTREYNRRVM